VKALAENCTPKELCDRYFAVHADIYRWFNISCDIFGRTTHELHSQITQDVFLKLKTNDFLEERWTNQLYCQQHHAFLADRFVEGECATCGYPDARGDQCDGCGKILDTLDLKNPRCKVDGSTPIVRETKHMFLRLDKLQPEIDAFYRQSAVKGAWSENGKRITEAWLKEGLIPRSITRDLKWGIAVPIPQYEDKVIYSWFDACIGYVSITAQYTPEWRRWWHSPDDVQLYQFLGKDNVSYHSVIFPGSQLGSRDDWTKLHHLSSTEYLTYEGGKFSKSRGVGVFGDTAKNTGIPADIWRFYLLSHRPESGDSEFNWDALISGNNNLLLKNLGNFINRVLKFLNGPHYEAIVPDYNSYGEASLDILEEDINNLLAQYIQELDAVKLRAALNTILRISQRGNVFLQSEGLDNKLAASQPLKCAAIIGRAVNLAHLIAALLAPYMPDTAQSIQAQLKTEPGLIPEVWNTNAISPGHTVGPAALLFQRLDPAKASEWRVSFGEKGLKKVVAKNGGRRKAGRGETTEDTHPPEVNLLG